MRCQFRIALAVATAASSLSPSIAFAPGSVLSPNHNIKHASHLCAEADASSTPAAVKPIEEGSHDELMYALGVNLARQLGDVRPLIENGDELTQLARGLLDTVVGKFNEEKQTELLGRRGDDLNKIIVDRA